MTDYIPARTPDDAAALTEALTASWRAGLRLQAVLIAGLRPEESVILTTALAHGHRLGLQQIGSMTTLPETNLILVAPNGIVRNLLSPVQGHATGALQ